MSNVIYRMIKPMTAFVSISLQNLRSHVLLKGLFLCSIFITVTVSYAGTLKPSGDNLFLDKQIMVGASLYLNACTGNPSVYANQPLIIGSAVVEIPNRVKEMKPSKYGRPFKVAATTSMNGDVDATLSNFRDLTILDDRGINFYSRRVTGASSLYQLKDSEATLGVGVGWHNKCPDFFTWLDFTVLRIVIPYRNAQGEMTTFQYVAQGLANSHFDIADFSNGIVIAEMESVGVGASAYYYHLPSFKAYNADTQKFTELNSIRKLKEHGIDLKRGNLLFQFFWLARNHQTLAFRELLESSLSDVVNSLQGENERSNTYMCDHKDNPSESTEQLIERCILPHLDQPQRFLSDLYY
jgi:hypothetical protein